MKIRNVIVCFIIALIIAVGIYTFLNIKTDKKEKNKEKEEIVETKDDTIKIDYSTYQELRSQVHENETYAIVIMNSNDEVCDTFREEILYSFQNLKSKVYEIDLDKLSELEMSGVITDISKVMGYDKPSIITPSVIFMKNGKVVYKKAGLVYSPDITKEINKNKFN